MRAPIRLFMLIATLCALPALAWAQDCNQPAAQGVLQVPLAGSPFVAIPTADGCTLFVSLTDTSPGMSQVAVLSRRAGKVAPAAVVPVAGQVTGMALSPDGKTLAATDGLGVTLLDAAKLVAGGGDATVATAVDGKGSEAVYAAFSPDGRLLAISDEAARAVTIYDFAAFSQGKPLKAIGKVPVAYGPTGLVFSPDSKRLYVAVQVAAVPGTECPAENGKGPGHAPGLLTVVDADRAAANPGRSVLAEIPAGCNPVRVALSADGSRVFVSDRGGDAVAMFDASRLLSARERSLRSVFKVGKSPVGLVASATRVFVTNSDRFGGGRAQSVSVIDPADPDHPKSIPAGGFPRELRLTADGKTLLITNFTGKTLELVDLDRVLSDR